MVVSGLSRQIVVRGMVCFHSIRYYPTAVDLRGTRGTRISTFGLFIMYWGETPPGKGTTLTTTQVSIIQCIGATFAQASGAELIAPMV